MAEQWPPAQLEAPGDKAKYALQAQLYMLGGCRPVTSPPKAPEKYFKHKWCWHGSRNSKLKRLPLVCSGRTSCRGSAARRLCCRASSPRRTVPLSVSPHFVTAALPATAVVCVVQVCLDGLCFKCGSPEHVMATCPRADTCGEMMR